MSDVANVLDLPNAKDLDRRRDWTYSNKGPETEMRTSLAEEIKCTIIAEKGKECYKNGLTYHFNIERKLDMSYHMTWEGNVRLQ